MELVEIKNGQTVTSSLQVAEVFKKNHRHVLRDIDNLKEGVQNWADLFIEDSYIHPQNKQTYRQIIISKDGFTLLAMGFTGKEALQFKVKYIEAFNQMENHIKTTENLNTPEDIMIATLQNIKNVKAEVKTVQADIFELKQEIDLTRKQKAQLSKQVRMNAMKAVGGKKSQAYESLYRIAIAEHWRTIKNYFEVSSYEEIPKLRFDEALELAECWQPSAELAL